MMSLFQAGSIRKSRKTSQQPQIQFMNKSYLAKARLRKQMSQKTSQIVKKNKSILTFRFLRKK